MNTIRLISDQPSAAVAAHKAKMEALRACDYAGRRTVRVQVTHETVELRCVAYTRDPQLPPTNDEE